MTAVGAAKNKRSRRRTESKRMLLLSQVKITQQIQSLSLLGRAGELIPVRAAAGGRRSRCGHRGKIGLRFFQLAPPTPKLHIFFTVPPVNKTVATRGSFLSAVCYYYATPGKRRGFTAAICVSLTSRQSRYAKRQKPTDDCILPVG